MFEVFLMLDICFSVRKPDKLHGPVDGGRDVGGDQGGQGLQHQKRQILRNDVKKKKSSSMMPGHKDV